MLILRKKHIIFFGIWILTYSFILSNIQNNNPAHKSLLN